MHFYGQRGERLLRSNEPERTSGDQSLQNVDSRLQRSRSVRHRRVPLSSRLLATQSSENGSSLGGERVPKSLSTARERHSVSETDRPEEPRARHGVHRSVKIAMTDDDRSLSFSLFAGENGWPAAKLKDAPILDESEGFDLYVQLIRYMRTMFVKCKLIHADLSEFNLLLDEKKKLYVIDVSQSVEQAHPNALEFLRMDIRNVTEYFSKRYTSQPLLSVQQLFNYITDPTISDENEQEYLDKSFEQAKLQPMSNEVDDRVFQQIFIPQTLDDLPESSSKDFRQMSTILGMNETMTAARLVPQILESQSSAESSDSESDSESDYASAQEEQSTTKTNNVRPRDESPNSRTTEKTSGERRKTRETQNENPETREETRRKARRRQTKEKRLETLSSRWE